MGIDLHAARRATIDVIFWIGVPTTLILGIFALAFWLATVWGPGAVAGASGLLLFVGSAAALWRSRYKQHERSLQAPSKDGTDAA